MNLGFTIKDRQIEVDDTYFAKDFLNEYFKHHKLKQNCSMEKIKDLIDSVCYVYDESKDSIDDITPEDFAIIKEMLEDVE